MNPVAARRLANQRLVGPPLADPQSVVAWFGAVQGQEYALAQWALALRLSPTTERAIEAAFAAGDIVRTHAMRPTWHFVAPADIRWLQALTGPRVQQVNAGMYRNEGMDSDLRLRAAPKPRAQAAWAAAAATQQAAEAEKPARRPRLRRPAPPGVRPDPKRPVAAVDADPEGHSDPSGGCVPPRRHPAPRCAAAPCPRRAPAPC